MKKIYIFVLMSFFVLAAVSMVTPRVAAQETEWPKQLTTNSFGDIEPVWHPDGSKIAYIAFPGRGIWVMNADGTEKTCLTSGHVDQLGGYSPDGSKIVFQRYGYRGSQSDVMIMNADGTGVTRITFGGIPEMEERSFYSPVWSPDGKTILFNYAWDDRWDIGVMNVDGTNITILGPGQFPHYCSGGSKIIYNSPDTKCLYLMNSDGTGVEKLTDGPGDYRPDMSPTGWIVFSRAPLWDPSLDILL